MVASASSVSQRRIRYQYSVLPGSTRVPWSRSYTKQAGSSIAGNVVFDGANGGWQGDGETHQFRVVMNSFAAAGNDNHLDFKDGTNRVDILIDYWDYIESLVDHMAANTPTTFAGDQGRITIIGEVSGFPCNLPASCTPAHAADHPNCQHL